MSKNVSESSSSKFNPSLRTCRVSTVSWVIPCPPSSSLPPLVLKEILLAQHKGLYSQCKLLHAVQLRKVDTILILLYSPRLKLLQSMYHFHSVRRVLSLNLEMHKRKSGETIMSLWVPYYLSQRNECFLIILYCSPAWSLGFIFIDTFIVDLQAGWQISTVMFNSEK